MRLIQFKHADGVRVAVTDDADSVSVIDVEGGVYALALMAIQHNISLADLVQQRLSDITLPYQDLIDNKLLLPPITHPDDAHCLVTGTGLTHLGSADTRDGMHSKLNADSANLTDSMRMFKLGLENGKPGKGKEGAQPEWFYKGDGSSVVSPEQPLPMPSFAQDGGEEPELVGMYIIDPNGTPVRVGFAIGNEFSDHITEKENYLWLAHSKLRACSFGPELYIGELPSNLQGTSKIVRDGTTIWEKPFLTGEDNMSHSLENLEFHHFKYQIFRKPGDLHIHFFGTSTLSFADNVQTQEGDVFEIEIKEFGRALRNPLKRDQNTEFFSIKGL